MKIELPKQHVRGRISTEDDGFNIRTVLTFCCNDWDEMKGEV